MTFAGSSFRLPKLVQVLVKARNNSRFSYQAEAFLRPLSDSASLLTVRSRIHGFQCFLDLVVGRDSDGLSRSH